MISIGSPWWDGALAALCVGVGLLFVVHVVLRVGDRMAQLAHAVISLAMAGMFWPGGDPVPAGAGVVIFAVLGSWFAAVRLRRGRSATGGATHLTIGSAAMTLMYLEHGHGGSDAAGGHAGHAGHGAVAQNVEPSNPALVALALLLTGYFAWHTWACIGLLNQRHAAAGTAAGGSGVLTRERLAVDAEPIAHIVMSALMAVMFLGIV
ncbi:DUF5134 domain-containing protein [Pseudonocardia sp.]|uniref:DUF5134 domain-containing protein n=1 Tax=Pseudonocardia sp. TaxID=60912 RepID=UPI0031FC35FC